NPCPCAFADEDLSRCICTVTTKRRYLAKLSGPLLDRVDLCVTMRPLSRLDLGYAAANAEPSSVVAERVAAARDRMAARYAGESWRTNVELPANALHHRYTPDTAGLDLLHTELGRGRLTARGMDRVVRAAWSIADLAGHERPTVDDVAVALSFKLGVWSS